MFASPNFTTDVLSLQLKSLSENNQTEKDRVIRKNQHNFEILCGSDNNIVNSISGLPDFVFHQKNHYATLPLSQSNSLKLIEFAKRKQYWFNKSAGEKILELFSVDIPGLNCSLYEYQKEAVKFLIENKKVILADEMGLGKSVEALAACQLLEFQKILIVCPATLKTNWANEISQKLENNSVTILNGGKLTEIKESRFVIVNYDILLKRAVQLKEIAFDAVIFDESHKLKNADKKKSDFILELVAPIDYRFMLTGTPIENRPVELINQLKILGRLRDFGGAYYFIERYCAGVRGISRSGKEYFSPQGASNLCELNEKLQDSKNGFLRRLKKDVLHQLPPKRVEKIVVGIDNVKEYRKANSNIIEYLRNITKDTSESTTSNYSLSDVLKKAYRSPMLVQINKLRELSTKGKMDTVIEWAKSFKETNQKLIIFYWRTEVGSNIAQALNAPIINGAVDEKQKEVIYKDFRENPDTHILVVNIKSGSLGIDLTVCSNVAFCELDMSPAAHLQAEDRCHRLNQINSVNIYYFVAKDTIDEKIYNLLERKKKVINLILNEESEEKIDSNDELIDLYFDDLKL